MNYTFFAIGCYIVMRGLQVLFEEQSQKTWFKILIKVIAVITIYAALASLIVWYKEVSLLGFNAGE
jgi:hypothetical protein